MLFKLSSVESNNNEKVESAKEFLTGIILEMSQKYNLLSANTVMDNNLCYIFFFRNNDDVIKMQILLENIMKDASRVFNLFGVNLISTSSNSHIAPETLPKAYREAMNLLVSKQKDHSNGLFYYMDTKEPLRTSYYYPIEKELLIIQLLKSGNQDMLVKEVSDILSANIDGNFILSLESTRCMFLDILSTVFKTCKTGNPDDLNLDINDISTIRLIMNCTDVSVMSKVTINLFRYCCEEIKMLSFATSDNTVISAARDYIDTHYNDPTLCISSIASYFSVHPNYLSKMFKTETHINLSGYINNVRIREAKFLLSQPNSNIEEIGKKTGFGSYRTFTRVFRQIVGITPSDYKSLIGSKNLN
jgi:YesN/AraC family two-component response regulator